MLPYFAAKWSGVLPLLSVNERSTPAGRNGGECKRCSGIVTEKCLDAYLCEEVGRLQIYCYTGMQHE